MASRALFNAIERGRVDDCMTVIADGVDVNAKCDVMGHRHLGETPLIAAAKKNMESVCKALIEKGAMKEAKNRRGKTALEMVSARASDSLKELLHFPGAPEPAERKPIPEKGSKPTDPASKFITAVDAGDVAECMRLLNEENVSVNPDTDLQFSPLIAAAKKGLYDLCVELVKRGANVNARNRYYSTPLLVAVANGHEKLTFYLLEQGAELNTKNIRGKSVISCASKPMARKLERWQQEHQANGDAEPAAAVTA